MDFDNGTAGASAAREHARRKAAREARVRASHPRTAELRLLVADAPQHERSWDQGRRGEEEVGASLERRTAGTDVVLLHDRRRTARTNIDHLAVAPSGVYVIDAKAVTGAVRVRRPLLGTPQLVIAGRKQDKLLDGLDRQVAAVAAIVGDDVTVHGVLCFTKADLPLLGTMTVRGHLLLYRKGLAKRLVKPGPNDAASIRELAGRLKDAFPEA